ncbi:MAG TPA: NAD(P)-binding protein [Candidatus Dormibacteraeota bacterium]|jgi:spermidine dehydrogenase|nr:NAD(P)-binding protein [Candidatus Dormibacteraeota bacterium]
MPTDNEEKNLARDLELGMDRAITRRDFLNGAAMTIGSAALPSPGLSQSSSPQEKQNAPDYNPPVTTGLRGSHPGSFEIAHSLRDGTFWQTAGKPIDTGERYDLIVVGGGISGLSAAYFFRELAGKNARILILENHNDFGGHAKRNEFHLGGKLQLLNGGTMLIDSPTAYSKEAAGLIAKLGIDPIVFEKKYPIHDLYSSLGLGSGIFFDKPTFGEDGLVTNLPSEWSESENARAKNAQWSEFLKKAPLSDAVKQDILRIETADTDYLPGLPSAEKKDRLSRISYKDFLLTIAKVDPGVVAFYQTRTNGEWGVGIDAEPALDCWALGLPGFQGMKLDPGTAPRMSYSAAGYATGGSPRFHFPDGNATIARLLVRELIPDAVPGYSAEDVVTTQVAYGHLDKPANPIRIRLNSTVVRAQNTNGPKSSQGVEVTYATNGKVFTAQTKGCILACWNMTIPYLCPDLPEKQKEALHYLVKVPLVYTSVGLRNWTAFKKLGIHSIQSPGAYWNSASLNWPIDIGDYKSPRSPEEPILLHMSRTPCKRGLPAREQHKAGRMELLITSFETFERNIRDQLARSLSGGGFDPSRDIEAITVNRWPHGYGYEYNPLFDPEWPKGEAPHEIGRKPHGRITIANSDSGATAYTDVAIDQGFRAVKELSFPRTSP